MKTEYRKLMIYSSRTVKARQTLYEVFSKKYSLDEIAKRFHDVCMQRGLRWRLDEGDYLGWLTNVKDVAIRHVHDHLLYTHVDKLEVKEEWAELGPISEEEFDQKLENYRAKMVELVIIYAQGERLKRYLRAPHGDQASAANRRPMFDTPEGIEMEKAVGEAMGELYQAYARYSLRYPGWKGLFDGPVDVQNRKVGW